MKHVKMFESFINEDEVKSKLKYSKNYIQQDQTWLKDITQAQSEDKWRNQREKQEANTPQTFQDSEKAKLAPVKAAEFKDPIKAQRELLTQRIDPDGRYSKFTDAEIKRELNDLKKRIKDELENSKAYFSVNEKLEEMVKYNKIHIECMGDSVPDNLKVRFVLPCITSAMAPKEAWEFIHDVTELDVKVTGRHVVDKWEVVYTGTIVTNDKKVIEFHDVNNGLAVNLN